MSILDRLVGKEARFCRWCGEPLTVRRVVSHADPHTGEKVYVRRGDCPRILAGTVAPGELHPHRPSPMWRGQL